MKNLVEILVAIVIVAVVAFAWWLAMPSALKASDTPPAPGVETRELGEVTAHGVGRIIDEQMGVVCYVSDGGYSGGISCLYLPLRHPSHPDRQPQRDQP